MLESYKDSLKYYPISRKRAIEKFNNMVKALKKIGSDSSETHPCIHKDLGQSFRPDGSSIHTNLKRFNYNDKSGFQWAFACLFNEKANRVTITKMMSSSQVKESVLRTNNPILEFWNRIENLPKNRPIQ